MKMIELCSGLGAFANPKVSTVLISDIDPKVNKAYKLLHGEVRIIPDMLTIPACEYEGVDVVTYSPPCQDFSSAGRRQGSLGKNGSLLFYLPTVLKNTVDKPKFIIFENVSNLKKFPDYKNFIDMFTALGYYHNVKIITPLQVGIPQSRDRIFIVFSLEPFDYDIPEVDLEPLSSFLTEEFLIIPNKTPSRRKIFLNNKNLLEATYANTITTNQDRHPNSGVIPYDDWFRYLSPLECFLLQGYSREEYMKLHPHFSVRDLWKFIGNAINRKIALTILQKVLDIVRKI